MSESKPLLADVRLSDPAVLVETLVDVLNKKCSEWATSGTDRDAHRREVAQWRARRLGNVAAYTYNRLLSLLERQTYALKVAAEGTEIDELYGALCEADHWKRLYEHAKQSPERQTAVVTYANLAMSDGENDVFACPRCEVTFPGICRYCPGCGARLEWRLHG